VASASTAASYMHTDTKPLSGINFYRVRMVENNGAVSYSKVVKAQLPNKLAEFTVSPNPVSADGSTSLIMKNVPSGELQIRLLNMGGKVIWTQSLQHDGAISKNYPLRLNKMTAKGHYKLEIKGQGIASKILNLLY